MKILLITGNTPGHNLFPLKEILKEWGHDVTIALTLKFGKKEFERSLESGQPFEVVISAKNPTDHPGNVRATLEKVLEFFKQFRHHHPQVKLAVVSGYLEGRESDQLAQQGVNFFYSDELEKIKKFCLGTEHPKNR